MVKSVFIPGEAGSLPNYCGALQAVGCKVSLCTDPARSCTCDGLLLPGGGDIANTLDETERRLIQSFVETHRPIFGICRGMQALNVWFGGTLHGHIPGHQLPKGDIIHPSRCIDLMKDLLGQTPTVNSNHHQAVDRLGRDLRTLQWTADGTIEAICHKSLPIWGVQWHPERQSFGLRRRDAVDASPLFYYFRSQLR